MRLTERLLLLDISEEEEPGDYLLVDEHSGAAVGCDIEDGARLLAGIVHFAVIRPAFKEAVLAHLCTLDEERRGWALGALRDAVAEIEHAEAVMGP